MTLTAARPAAGVQRGARPLRSARPAGWPAWSFALGVACVYAALGLDRHRTFHTSAYDLGIFHQAVAGWAHLGLPWVPLKGVHENLGAHYDLLADHFHPILAVWAPTYWIWPHPATLLIDQAVTIALAVVPVWRYSSRALHSERAALAVVALFASSWGLTTAIGFDVHEIAFAIPLLALGIERADANRWGAATVAILMLLLVKEDLGLVVAAFGVWILLAHRKRWRRGTVLLVGGIAGYWLTVHELMPAFDHGRSYAYWSYGSLGPDLPGALLHVVRHPVDTVRLLVAPAAKVKLLAFTFLPAWWLSWLSPLAILMLPLLAERLLSSRPALYDTRFHYAATTVPVLTLAFVDALRRRGNPVWTRNALIGGALATVVLFPVFDTGLRFLVTPQAWTTSAQVMAEEAAVQVIPRDARVAADTRLVPHLIDRCGKALCPVWLLDGSGRDTAQADWVVADVARPEFPLGDARRVAALVARLEAAGWEQVWTRDGYVVLHRT